ncbi:MAG: hypothetical protein MZV64_13490 [Ignavibacteriales bacterium]|nr:hypothetical protein [Ignavibacteriales bacterium]
MGGAGTFDGVLLNAVPGAAHRGQLRRPRACARGTWNGARPEPHRRREQLRRRDRRRGAQGQRRRCARTGASRSGTRARTGARRSTPVVRIDDWNLSGPPPRLRPRRVSLRRGPVRASSTCYDEYLEPRGFGRRHGGAGRRVRRDAHERVGLAAVRRHRASGSTRSRSARARPASCAARRTSSGRGPTPSTWTRGRSPSSRSTCWHSRRRRSPGTLDFTSSGSGAFLDPDLRRRLPHARSLRQRRGHRRRAAGASRCAATT